MKNSPLRLQQAIKWLNAFQAFITLFVAAFLSGCTTTPPPLNEMARADVLTSASSFRPSAERPANLTIVRNDRVSLRVEVQIDGVPVGFFNQPYQRLDLALPPGEYLVSVHQTQGGLLSSSEDLRAKTAIRIPTKFSILRARIDQTGILIKYLLEQDSQ